MSDSFKTILSWRNVLPMLLAQYAEGNKIARDFALGELYRMADLADAHGYKEKADVKEG